MTPYDTFLNKLLDLNRENADHNQPGGYKLGSYSRRSSRATLYAVEHTHESHERLRNELTATGVRYRMVIEQPPPGDSASNIQLLDIDV